MKMISDIIQIVKDNPILMTIFGVSGAGIITFWIKDVPKSIYAILKRELTTEVIITSQHKIFYEMTKWIEVKYKDASFRKLKISNGKWGEDDSPTTSIGYGPHLIWYRKFPLIISLYKDNQNQTERDKEYITLSKLGRSKALFVNMINEIMSASRSTDKMKLFTYDNYWCYSRDQMYRSMETIFIEKEKKDLLYSSLDSFKKNEQWYLNNGIPYQFGLLLYGPPGTGKTSLIKAIATYLNYSIYYLSPQKLSHIGEAMSHLPDKSILVVEDIDSSYVTHVRDNKQKQNRIKNKRPAVDVISPDEDVSDSMDSIFEAFSMGDLSAILNALDGMFSVHGRILIATTNHIEKLDEALIRPGRIDLKIEIGYVNAEILRSFLDKFYPGNTVCFDRHRIKSDLTVAMLQNMVLQKYTADQIMKEITIY